MPIQQQVTALPRPKMVLVEYTTHGTEAWEGDTFVGYDDVQSGTMVMEESLAEDMTPAEYRHFKILGPVPPGHDRVPELLEVVRCDNIFATMDTDDAYRALRSRGYTGTCSYTEMGLWVDAKRAAVLAGT